MRRIKRARRRIQVALGFTCLALGATIYRELDRSDFDSAASAAPAQPAPRTAPIEPAPRFTMPPLRDYAEVVARPLFSETRRPPPPEVSRGPAAQPSSFTLVGIVVSDRERHALIEHGQPPRIDRVVEGQELDGWIVDTILPGKVVVRRADAQEEIKPKDKPPRTPPRPPQRNG